MSKVSKQFSKTQHLFLNHEHFVYLPIKGGRYCCELCKSPLHERGQQMSLKAALKHEQQNEKHRRKVEEEYCYKLGYWPEWGWEEPPKLSDGTTVWERTHPADRAEDFIEYWRENVAIALDKGAHAMETMDSFIERYNEKYTTWEPEEQVSPAGPVDEQKRATWGEVQDELAETDSYEPEDYDSQDREARKAHEAYMALPVTVDEEQARYWLGEPTEEEVMAAWGLSPEESEEAEREEEGVRGWVAQQQGSDATDPEQSPAPGWQALPETGLPRTKRDGKNHDRRGQDDERKDAIVDGHARSPMAWGTQKAKIRT